MNRSVLSTLCAATTALWVPAFAFTLTGCERDQRTPEERPVLDVESGEGEFDATEEPNGEDINVTHRDES